MMGKLVLERARKRGEALTFDDVRLRTGFSKVLPDDVSLETMFSRNVPLKIPIVSAAMDTVTEYRLATELAKLGGLGVIHRSLSPEEQAAQVARVKHNLNGLISKPICVSADETISEVLTMRERKNYGFHSFPVVDINEMFLGVITGNDFDFCSDTSQLVRDVMTSGDLLTAPAGLSINEAYELMRKAKRKILPLVTPDNKIAGLYVFSDVQRIINGDADTHNVDDNGQLIVGAAIGVGDSVLSRVDLLVGANVDVVVIDTAHADTSSVYDTLREIKHNYSDLDVVVGNVSIGAAAKRLIDNGADGIKIGQGPGSICTTRRIAGIGRPQVSAIYDCVRTIINSGVPMCADGGLTDSGDIPIAIAAGAHSVMMGSLLAGTEETPGQTWFEDGQQWKGYRGMGSLSALEDNKSSRERYLQGSKTKGTLVPEGVEGRVPYKGRLCDVVYQLVGGLRSGMGYVGAADIEELRDKGDFDRITNAGLHESHPHDIEITRSAPNYGRRK